MRFKWLVTLALATVLGLGIVTPGGATHDQVEAAKQAKAAAVPASNPVSPGSASANRQPAKKCNRLAFSVNDYGKVEPAKDAKRLLGQYIARWTAQRGIKTYQTGRKKVTCKLFLDFGFFDEYTCRAEASFCW